MLAKLLTMHTLNRGVPEKTMATTASDIAELWRLVHRSASDTEVLEQLTRVWKRFEEEVHGAFTSGHSATQLASDGEDFDGALAELRSRGRGHIVEEFNRAHSTTRDAVSALCEEAFW